MNSHHDRFISYLRVSTERQGKSGLGIDAQRQAIADYLNGSRWTLAASSGVISPAAIARIVAACALRMSVAVSTAGSARATARDFTAGASPRAPVRHL